MNGFDQKYDKKSQVEWKNRLYKEVETICQKIWNIQNICV